MWCIRLKEIETLKKAIQDTGFIINKEVVTSGENIFNFTLECSR